MTRSIAVLGPPARRAGAGSVDGVAGPLVGTLTRLIAAQAPKTTGAGDGAVHALPTWQRHTSVCYGTIVCKAATYRPISHNSCGLMLVCSDLSPVHK